MRFFRRSSAPPPSPPLPLTGKEGEQAPATAPGASKAQAELEAPRPGAGGFAAGEDREVTVLFADLEGFTRMTEQLPAVEVVALLNAYFTVMTAEVEHFGGTVDKFIGDAMLVYWSGPSPQAAAELAVRAALGIQTAVAALQGRLLREGRRPAKVRIGISSGRAILGEIGGAHRRETTVIGDAVNTAARLESLNKEFHTDSILSGSTHALVADRAIVRDLGLVPIKGRRESVRAYALIGWAEAGA